MHSLKVVFDTITASGNFISIGYLVLITRIRVFVVCLFAVLIQTLHTVSKAINIYTSYNVV